MIILKEQRKRCIRKEGNFIKYGGQYLYGWNGHMKIVGIMCHHDGCFQCWAKSQEQCQPSGCFGTFAGQGGGMPELIPARLSYQQESSRLIFFQPASYIVF